MGIVHVRCVRTMSVLSGLCQVCCPYDARTMSAYMSGHNAHLNHHGRWGSHDAEAEGDAAGGVRRTDVLSLGMRPQAVLICLCAMGYLAAGLCRRVS